MAISVSTIISLAKGHIYTIENAQKIADILNNDEDWTWWFFNINFKSLTFQGNTICGKRMVIETIRWKCVDEYDCGSVKSTIIDYASEEIDDLLEDSGEYSASEWKFRQTHIQALEKLKNDAMCYKTVNEREAMAGVGRVYA